MSGAGHVAVVGAGIAGLTCALAFSARGFDVTVLERSPKLDEVGAGLQLSPNATRILDRLGVLPELLAAAVRPEEVVLRRASSLRQIAAVPLGAGAVERWHALYLTIHRADLQAALVKAVERQPRITLRLGVAAQGVSANDAGMCLAFDRGGVVERQSFDLVVAADGVWSALRGHVQGAAASRYSGYTAWRALLDVRSDTGWMPPADRVTTFLHRNFHLVAYPVREGSAINLVAITEGVAAKEGWANSGDASWLRSAMAGSALELLALVERAAPWTTWPLHEVPPTGSWIDPAGIALIGDAAHAMTPFAAQGAAMAIEDAAVLAKTVANTRGDIAEGLRRYEAVRRSRVERVARRGAFNRFTWHAAGPIALGRDAVLALRSGQSLAADMDWLYGWDAEIDTASG